MDRLKGSRRISKQAQKSQTISGRVATEGLIASIHELSHTLRALQLQNSRLRFRQEVLFGLWISSRQAVRVLQASIWPSADQLKQLLESPFLNAAVELEEAMLSSMGEFTGADPLQPYLPARPSPGCSKELILSLIDGSKITGLSEASLLGGTPTSIMLAVLLCFTYDPDLVSSTLKAQEPGSKHLVMEHYDRMVREVKDALAALKNPQQSAGYYKEMLMVIVVKLILAAAGTVMGVLQFPACGVNSFVFTTEEKYLPPDALLDQYVPQLCSII
jgi:hypothetical protein